MVIVISIVATIVILTICNNIIRDRKAKKMRDKWLNEHFLNTRMRYDDGFRVNVVRKKEKGQE